MRTGRVAVALGWRWIVLGLVPCRRITVCIGIRRGCIRVKLGLGAGRGLLSGFCGPSLRLGRGCRIFRGLLLIILGAMLILKPWFDKQGLFGKAEES